MTQELEQFYQSFDAPAQDDTTCSTRPGYQGGFPPHC
jgi:hypothetical protein